MSYKYGDKPVQIMEDWNERDGKIYYRWKAVGESEWHEKLTPYKEKPFVQLKYMTDTEYTLTLKICPQCKGQGGDRENGPFCPTCDGTGEL